MKLNEKIYWCRKKIGLSQEALAELIGVSRQSISKWETGDASPEISKLPLLAKAFGVTADWLLSEDGIPEEAPPTPVDPQPEIPHEPQPAVSAAPFPEWVEHLPGFIGRAVKKFGWLYGVRTAVSGLLFTLFGFLMRAVTRSTLDAANDLGMMDPFFAEKNAGITWYDEAGNVIDTPYYADEVIEALGLTTPAPSGISVSASGPFDLVSGFVIFMGVITLIAGIVMAVLLKKWGEQDSLKS